MTDPLSNAQANAENAGRLSPHYYVQWRDSLNNRAWLPADWSAIVAELGDDASLHDRDLFAAAVFAACQCESDG